ncbi:hypothetical protein G7054_g13556 [Neopestalotiopsis clavispora]|nr:hypothetical protein G7054_g13556 [Neopestalotiopsis clavispora]
MGAGISVEKLLENVTAQYERNIDGQKTRLKALLVRNPESGCLGRINIETDRMKADRKTSKLKKIDHTHKCKCHDTIKGETKPDKKKNAELQDLAWHVSSAFWNHAKPWGDLSDAGIEGISIDFEKAALFNVLYATRLVVVVLRLMGIPVPADNELPRVTVAPLDPVRELEDRLKEWHFPIYCWTIQGITKELQVMDS